MPAKRMIQEKKYLKKEMTAVMRMRIWTKKSLVQRYARFDSKKRRLQVYDAYVLNHL